MAVGRVGRVEGEMEAVSVGGNGFVGEARGSAAEGEGSVFFFFGFFWWEREYCFFFFPSFFLFFFCNLIPGTFVV